MGEMHAQGGPPPRGLWEASDDLIVGLETNDIIL